MFLTVLIFKSLKIDFALRSIHVVDSVLKSFIDFWSYYFQGAVQQMVIFGESFVNDGKGRG